jgi:hypothetical protein
MDTILRAACLIIVVALLSSCEPTLERRVLEYERQVNARNIDRVLDLFAEDATFELQGSFSLSGKDALRDLAEWDSVLHSRLTLHRIETEGDTVLCDVSESNEWLAAVGILEVVHPTTMFVFKDGLIIHIQAETDSMGTRAIRGSLDAVLEWALLDRPQKVRELISDTGFVYNAENAVRWLQLLEDWKMSVREDG